MKKAQTVLCLAVLLLLITPLEAGLISGDFFLGSYISVLHPHWNSGDPYPPVSDSDEVRFTFQPAGEQIEIHLGACETYENPSGASWGIELTDTSTGQLVWGHWLGDGLYALNPAHTYEFYLHAETTVSQADISNGAQAEVYFFITPEPTTLCLIAFGAIIAGSRRKRKC